MLSCGLKEGAVGLRVDLARSGCVLSIETFNAPDSEDKFCGVDGLFGLAEYPGEEACLFCVENLAAVTSVFDDFRSSARYPCARI